MRRVLLAATALTALLLGGCGIPDNSGVRVLGAGPSAGPAFGDDNTPAEAPNRDATIDPPTFVNNYLQAAAGDPENALNRVRAFLAPEARAGFKPQGAAGVQVIHLVEKPLVTPGSNNVELTVRTVGVLQDDGELVPSSDPTPTHLSLVLAMRGAGGLFVTDAPAALLLTDTALNTYYQPRTIYFWDNDYTGLVPDVRYMPLSVPIVQQPTTILNWLAGGPADWLKSAVQAWPQGTTAPDNIPAISNDRLQISLSAQAVTPGDDKGMDRLRQQLQWSLRPLVPHTLEIKIGHQDPRSYLDAEYLSSNAASRLLDVPERFVIFNGVIRRLSESPRAVAAIPLLKPEANRTVQSAAMASSTTHTFAAVVAGAGAGVSLRVASASTGQQADPRVVRGLSGPFGHPVWAVTSAGDAGAAVGLITAKGRLYSFAADGSPAEPVEWQGGDLGAVSAVAVAPDGHRVALVAGGKLYRTVLTVSGDGVRLASPDQILPPTLRSVAAVAWSSEQWLVVAGVGSADNRVTVMDVTSDGALSKTRLQDIGGEPVTYLSAYPASPIGRLEVSNSVSYVAAGEAWDVLSDPVKITAADLAGPAGSPPAGTTPTAPFFLD